MTIKMSRLERGFYKITRERILEEQDYKCHYCKRKLTRKEATLDHVLAISKCGRRHSDSNTVVSCVKCNSAKSNKNVNDFKPEKTDVQLNEMLERIEQRVRLAEWRLDFQTKGSFHKWEKFHIKRGRWKV